MRPFPCNILYVNLALMDSLIFRLHRKECKQNVIEIYDLKRFSNTRLQAYLIRVFVT